MLTQKKGMVMDYRQGTREINYRARYDALWELITHRREAEKILKGSLSIPSVTDFNFPDIHGYTLLTYACAMGDIDAVHKLLTLPGIKIDQATGLSNKTAIQLALESGHLNIAKILKNSGAKIQLELANIRCAECYEWAYGLLESLLHARTTRPEIKIYLSVCLNKLDDLKILKIDYSREFFHMLAGQSHASTYAPLVHTAIRYGHHDIVEYLLTGAIGLTTHGLQPDILVYAIQVNQNQLAEKFLDRYRQLRLNVNTTNHLSQSALILSTISNDPILFSKLLKACVNLRTTDYLGNNFLHYIAQNNNAVLFELLHRQYPEELHALCRQKNNVGETPLDMARRSGHDTLANRLKLTSPAPYLGSTQSSNIHAYAIHSEKVTQNLNYFLLMNYQETLTFSKERVDKILSLLFLHYSHQNKLDYFYDCLNLITQWDGSEDGLEERLQNTPAKIHGECQSVFEKWIEDISQCQRRLANTSQYLTSASVSTQQIGFQHRLRSFLNREPNSRITYNPPALTLLNDRSRLIVCDKPKNIPINRIHEMLEQFMSSAEGMCLEIRNSNQMCMLYRLPQERIAIYNPNSNTRLRDFDNTADLGLLISKIFAAQDTFSHPGFMLATNIYQFQQEVTPLRPDADFR